WTVHRSCCSSWTTCQRLKRCWTRSILTIPHQRWAATGRSGGHTSFYQRPGATSWRSRGRLAIGMSRLLPAHERPYRWCWPVWHVPVADEATCAGCSCEPMAMCETSDTVGVSQHGQRQTVDAYVASWLEATRHTVKVTTYERCELDVR